MKYSDEQVDQARNIDIVSFLERFEGFTFKQAGRFLKCIEHDSLMIQADRRGWFWNSHGVGGNNAISYLQKIHNLDFPTAVGQLIGENPSGAYYQTTDITPVDKPVEREFSLPEKADGKYARAFAYLNKSRFIAPNIISELMHSNKIYQDKRGNIVFVGFDGNNEARYAAIRGTLTDKQYRGEIGGSDKSFGFNMSGTDTDRIYVFEAPIDAMSHATLANLILGNENAWKQHSRLSLGGCCDNALERYLSEHINVKEIVLCLDNDGKGQENAQRISEKYIEKGYSVRIRPPKKKDYNEDLAEFIGLFALKLQLNSNMDAVKNIGICR